MVVVLVTATVACQPASQRARPPKRDVQVSVVDEAGQPVATAQMLAIGNSKPIDIPGTRTLQIDQPVAGTIQADGYLSEPFVIDPDDRTVSIKLFSRVGPSGAERLSFQFGGDVMMGRRYQQPVERSDTPVATTDAGAESVVQYVAPIMAAADASTVNLETVVGQLPASGAYPAKRFLLQSPPVVLAALHDLGVDLVTLGNNHAYDWQEPGVASTIAALDGAGIAWAGAGTTAAQAQAGRMIDVRGKKVGVVSATTVNGDFVNDNLPTADEPEPADVPAKDTWQYDERSFGFGNPGTPGYIPTQPRRPGAAWTAFEELEGSLDADQAAAVWAELSLVYPELQDWVARRGHGGAAPFNSAVVARSIAQLRADGADLVIVEIHGGFQFSDVASEFAVQAAHAAIDAGADLVVGHHPHVLQGFEWYQGHLIAYSLGNFVFDQDFLSTFPSVILRTVFEGDRLIDARVIPLAIDRYRPVPVGGVAAARVIRLTNARSALAAYSDRIEPRIIGSIIDTHMAGNAVLSDTGTTGQIIDARDSSTVAYHLDPAGIVTLPPCVLVRTGTFQQQPSSDTAVEVGVDLMQWGDIDDTTANDDSRGGTQWVLTGNATVEVDGGNQFLRLAPTKARGVSVRQIARSSTPLHKLYDSAAQPVDGEPNYTVHVRVRGAQDEQATLRIAVYDVDDTDPTTEPVSTLLHETPIPLSVKKSTQWTDLDIDVTSELSAPEAGVRPNAALLYVELPRGSARIDIDEMRLMEWRDLSAVPANVWVAADALRGAPAATIDLEQSGCSTPTG